MLNEIPAPRLQNDDETPEFCASRAHEIVPSSWSWDLAKFGLILALGVAHLYEYARGNLS